MEKANMYLKPNVLAEPLFNQWYAWSGLIYPATAAMYITNSHMKTMQSFISAPQLHVAALKNPKNMGGPYVNYDHNRVGEVIRHEVINDHLRDDERDPKLPGSSDHGVPIAEIRLLDRNQPTLTP